MNRKRSSGLSFNVSFLGLLVFIIINVWLSLIVKKLKNEALERELVIKREKAEVFRLKYHANAFRDIFCMNVNLREARLAQPIRHILTGNEEGDGSMQLLYLKADACSDCNIHIVDWLVRRNAGFDDFRIVAHSSNEFFLEDLYNQGVINDSSLIVWYDDDFYDYHLSDSSADLVFINKRHVVQALFPLDILKDTRLFDEYMQCIIAKSALANDEKRKEVLPM